MHLCKSILVCVLNSVVQEELFLRPCCIENLIKYILTSFHNVFNFGVGKSDRNAALLSTEYSGNVTRKNIPECKTQ